MTALLLALRLLGAPSAAATATAAAAMTAPLAAASVRDLHDAFIEAVSDSSKAAILRRLSTTVPRDAGDLEALFDLFMRFPDRLVRDAAFESLTLMQPDSGAQADPLLLRYLDQNDPDSQLFGVRAALQLRSAAALPLVRRIAERKFRASSADEGLPAERNAWWTQYEALSALAQWEGAPALPLLKRKADEAPRIARIIGTYLWQPALSQIARWARGGVAARAEAEAALGAPTPLPALRATREAMLGYLHNRRAPFELRRRLAFKIGESSTPEEVAQLLKDYAAEKDAKTRRLIAAALFSSRDQQIVPLLLNFAKSDPEPGVRAGARVQLKDMLPAGQYQALLQWAAANDPDPANREMAKRELAAPVH
ncbi:MAG: hypothetical protein KGO96_11775 [Elusimicrobia bacterium]|nr:hypothetical protein [Elusimicrobiota bacterium]MDE2236392.1 hypothetical protein [Elusimicrobiota bacterium]MDE2426573.1 hypothetical protein [Elusimicrobiota bacterium]